MSALILDGKKISAQIKEEIIGEIDKLKERGIFPGLAVILVGNDPGSVVYVRNKEKMAESIGIKSVVYKLDENTDDETILELIERLNNDKKVHGILVQLPLPKHLDEKKIIKAIEFQKDVDCFHMENVGKMAVGYPNFLPCTPAGIIEILKRSDIHISGKECVVVGRSNIVGKPMALMLLKENGTVTICHSKTCDLPSVSKRADILIAAVGKPHVITSDMIKPGAVVIDVGMNRLSDGKLVGDVDFENVKEIAGAITPVPGGVGPMTIMMLMKNTVMAAKNLNE